MNKNNKNVCITITIHIVCIHTCKHVVIRAAGRSAPTEMGVEVLDSDNASYPLVKPLGGKNYSLYNYCNVLYVT